MKIYKKDLNEFIEAVEKKAIKSINEKYCGMINKSNQVRLDKFKDDIKQIENFLIKAYELSEAISEEFNYYSEFYYMQRRIRDSLSQNRSITIKDIKDNEFANSLKKKMEIKLTETETEYNKVKAYIKNNTPKRGYEYLKELGFDVSSIPVYDNNGTNNTSLMVQVDKNKLFVCGDNK